MESLKSFRLNWLGYAFCNIGVTFASLPVNLLLLYYLTQVVGLSAGLAGMIVALPKLWDALIDPMFGGWVDRHSLRTKRRTPIIAISSLVLIVTLYAAFSLPEGASTLQVVLIALTLLVISSVAQTAIGVSQFALATEMTKTSVELSSLLALAAVLAQLFSVLGATMLPILVLWAGGGAAGYSGMALIIALASGGALAVFALATRNVPVRVETEDSLKLTIAQSLRRTAGNGVFYGLLGLVVCLNASTVILFSFLPFANQYVLNGTHETLALIQGCFGGAVLVGMIVSPVVVRFFRATSAMLFCNVAVSIVMVAMWFASYGPLWGTLAGLFLIGLGSGVIGVLIQTAILNSAGLKVKGGTVVALGFYLGIMVASIKVGSAGGAFAAGVFLELFDFQKGGVAQTETGILGIRLGYTLLPLALVALGSYFLIRTRRSEAAYNAAEANAALPA